MPQGKLTQLQRLKQANSRLTNENTKLREENKDLKAQIKELKGDLQDTKLLYEELASHVFKKKGTNHTPPKKKRKKRSKGSYKRAVPTEIDQTVYHTADTCTDCNTKLTDKKEKIYYQEDIILPKRYVTKHTVEQGYCNCCRKWISPIKIPSAQVILGENIRTTVMYMSTILRLSYSQIQDDLTDRFGLHVSQGEISNILQSKAIEHSEHYDKLKDRIRQEDVIHMDETSDRVGNQKKFTWLMQGKDCPEVIFAMGKSRGGGIAKKLYGNSTAALSSDDYKVYHNLSQKHQLCWAHLHRKLRDLATSGTLEGKTKKACEDSFALESTIYKKVRECAKQELNDRQRTYWVTILTRQLKDLAEPNTHDPKKLRTYKETLQKNIPKYLTCIRYPGIAPDNNQVERSLRHVVLKRKNSFGHTSERGAQTMSVLMSVCMTIKNRIKGTDQTFFEAYAGFEV